jgi:hypothetical protein
MWRRELLSRLTPDKGKKGRERGKEVRWGKGE